MRAVLVPDLVETVVLAAHEQADFNGDGYDDLIIGVQNENAGGHAGAGAVHVLYGDAPPTRLSAAQQQFWHQNVSGMLDAVEPGDHFGGALGSV